MRAVGRDILLVKAEKETLGGKRRQWVCNEVMEKPMIELGSNETRTKIQEGNEQQETGNRVLRREARLI